MLEPTSAMNCDCKPKENQEDQDEEDQGKTSKLFAYLSIKHVNLSMKHAILHQKVRQACWKTQSFVVLNLSE